MQIVHRKGKPLAPQGGGSAPETLSSLSEILTCNFPRWNESVGRLIREPPSPHSSGVTVPSWGWRHLTEEPVAFVFDFGFLPVCRRMFPTEEACHREALPPALHQALLTLHAGKSQAHIRANVQAANGTTGRGKKILIFMQCVNLLSASPAAALNRSGVNLARLEMRRWSG